MGLISALFGQAIAVPEEAAVLVIAIVGFAMHHLLVKSSLFLALLEWQQGPQRWVFLIMLLLAVSLVGLPSGGGAAAKVFLKGALAGDLAWLLGASAVGTMLLMTRFLCLLHFHVAGRNMPRLAAWPWLVLLPLAFWGPFLPAMAVSFAGLETLLISLPLIVVGWWLGTRYPGLLLRIRPGDIIHPLLRQMPHGSPLSLGNVESEPANDSPVTGWRGVWRRVMLASDNPSSLALPGVALLILLLLLLGSLILPFAR